MPSFLRRALQQVVEDLAAALLPAACRACGAPLPQPFAAAPAGVRAYSALYTGTLRRPLAGGLSLPLPLLCVSCCRGLERRRSAGTLPDHPEVACVTAFEPGPALFELVHALKYEACVEVAPWLGAFLASALKQHLQRRDAAVLVPVPLHPVRLAQRGYNQSALLAREVGRRLGLPLAELLLQRRRATRPQARLDRELRCANVAGAFARGTPLPEGLGRLILVDDVVTSGATAAAALAGLGCEARRTVVLALCQAHAAATCPHIGGASPATDESCVPERGLPPRGAMC